jgi:polyisoprenoid-binding protein YceI
MMAAAVAAAAGLAAHAEPKTYNLDPTHTYVSFEAPHIQAISLWRGKFDRTLSGKVVLDRQAKTGSIDVVIDASSIDFGLAALDEHVRGPEFLDAKQYPTASFKSEALRFEGDSPVEADGQLTLHGVTRPLTLRFNSFKCIMDPFVKVERCGADVTATINRSDFGISKYAEMTGSHVKLAIQVEGLLGGAAGGPPSAGK